MTDSRLGELKKIALEIRKDVVRMVGVSRSFGLASALTIVELLVYLYWEHMNVSFAKRQDADRDRLVLSKDSATSSLYACLARLGFFSRDELWSYRRLGATLQGYPDIRTPGVEAPGGIYGGGIGISCGIAHGLQMRQSSARVFCILGVGELSEGVVWESIDHAARNRLGNIFLLIDMNSKTGSAADSPAEPQEALAAKLEAFGWIVRCADGHDFNVLAEAFSAFDASSDAPKVLIASTCTGMDVSDLPGNEENEAVFLSKDDMERALSFLEREDEGQGR